MKGLRLGSKAGKYVPGELIRFDAKPAGLTRMEDEGVPEYSLAIIYDHITWPGDSKFKLQALPLSKAELARFKKEEIYLGLCAAITVRSRVRCRSLEHMILAFLGRISPSERS